MFSIDLLKGKELPEKIDLKKSVFKAVPILIPLLAVTLLGAAYQRDGAVLRDRQQALKENQTELKQYADDVAERNRINAQIAGKKKCLNGISTALSYRIQVSDVLTELVQALPDGIFVYEINMDRNSAKQKVQDSETDSVKQRLVVRRNLELVLCGYDTNKSDQILQDYINRLKQSELLSTIFLDIKPAGRQVGQVDEQSAVFYEIECVLREQG